ncbi:MAG: hypothetical protein JNK22_02555 [Rhodocyclaceae bacterium]|nr:hypothetical protein [Rhodocyclaceae bacterium]
MVKSPVTVEKWQPVAHARQLMLMHSFSFPPVLLDSWKLISEGAMARYLNGKGKWAELLAKPIDQAESNGLVLIEAKVVPLDQDILPLVAEGDFPLQRLWLVLDDEKRLCGVLSPFELMTSPPT